jgi:hypothetical protein
MQGNQAESGQFRPNKVSTTSAGNPWAGREIPRAGCLLDFPPVGSAGRDVGQVFVPWAGNVNV